ncbi:MAG TPA: GTP cyclohydrolase II RibA, partial [Rubrivivax sp.]|nr:GTP cyclohydrolase II RibA [Rubrivivax sp.]
QLAAVTSVPADPSVLGAPTAPSDDELACSAALTLCKRSRLIPALLLVALPADAGTALAAAQVLQIDPADAALAIPDRAAGLRRVSDARVPLLDEEDCTLVLFRELDGDAEHVAIVVGQPPADAPVPVRLHSACLTGDLLGSLRCDCGPQLQRAVARLAETGGVLLYLAQEGRGTGLANKLRAYRLQDAGLDTLQADRHLGFREDERDFAAAAAMLRALGHTRIQLLTNNPQKIAALRQSGIDVVDRLPLHGLVNAHNERYIRTKQQAGHIRGDD